MTQTHGIQYESMDPQQAADIGHLRTLAICHYCWGGVTMAFSSIFIVHVVAGIVMMSGGFGPSQQGGGPPPIWVGILFIILGSFAVAISWTIGLLTIYSGRCLVARQRRTLSLVMAGINCASVPFGTVLGVFTFVVLLRPSVRTMYEGYRM